MVDPEPNIPSINVLSTPLGYMGMSSRSTSTSTIAHIFMVNTCATYVGGTHSLGGTAGDGDTSSLGGFGGGGGISGPPPPHLLSNLVLNTILQNMG